MQVTVHGITDWLVVAARTLLIDVTAGTGHSVAAFVVTLPKLFVKVAR